MAKYLVEIQSDYSESLMMDVLHTSFPEEKTIIVKKILSDLEEIAALDIG